MMTGLQKEQRVSTTNKTQFPDKKLDQMKPPIAEKQEWLDHLRSPRKHTVDSDNRLRQHQQKQSGTFEEETDPKRCYGGEENEEKSDPSKEDDADDYSLSLSSLSSLTTEYEKGGHKLIFKDPGPTEKTLPEGRTILFSFENKQIESEDNKMTEALENKVLEFKTALTQDDKTGESMDKEALYYDVRTFFEEGSIPDGHSKNHGQELNNLGLQSDSFLTRSEEFQDTNRSVLDMLAVDGMSESNFLDAYTRENTWNIPPLDPQGKNLHKHLSNLFTSLKDEISPLAAREGINEKCLTNTLTSLWSKLSTKLTPIQMKIFIMDLEMNKGGMRLPVFLDCFNLCSAGGDMGWSAVSRKLQQKDELLRKQEHQSDGEEKTDLTEKEKKLEEGSDAGTILDVTLTKETSSEGVKKLDEKESKSDDLLKTDHVEVEEIGDALSEDLVVDKALEEDMEKKADKKGDDNHRRCQLNIDTEDQDALFLQKELQTEVYTISVAAVVDDDDDFQEANGNNGTIDLSPNKSVKSKTCKWRKKRVKPLQTKLKADLGMMGDGSDQGGLRKARWGHKALPTKWKEKIENSQIGGHGDIDEGHGFWKEHSDNRLFTDMRQEKIDVRVKYFRTKSCMEASGGGNSSWHGHNSSSSDSSSNKDSSDRQGSDGGDSFNNQHNNNNNNNRGSDQSPSNDSIGPQQQMVNKNIPGQDYKAVRKKHAQMSDEQLFDLLGSLSPDTGPDIQEDPGLLKDINQCLLILLHELPNHSDLSCSVCNVLHSLLRHFALCQQAYQKCPICSQLLKLGLYHVERCIESGRTLKESSSDVCHQLLNAADFSIEIVQTKIGRLCMKMKKYVVSVFHPPGLHGSGQHGMYSLLENEEANFSGLTTSSTGSADMSLGPSLSSVGSAPGGRILYPTGTVVASSINGNFNRSGSGRKFQSSLSSIPESPMRAIGFNRRSSKGKGKRRLSSESFGSKGSMELTGSKSDDGSLTEDTKQVNGSELQSSIGELQAEGFQSLPNASTDPLSTSLGPFDDTSVTTSMSSTSGQNEEGTGLTAEDVIYSRYKAMIDDNGNIFLNDARAGKPGYNQDPYETQKTYGMMGVMSLPIRPNIPLERDQLLSLTTAPTGEPGIGEVVYGTRRQIMKVAQYWARIRGNIEHESYKYQHREEGVILDSAKKHLRILRTRYQKKNQWMRLVHLGNGVAGKCHLANDTTSNFNFCVKRVHIAKYEENELMTWCDLDHQNIVKLYGAIRHGCKIYIFCEFIAGGSLTSLINEQRNLNRRLSHWMCLRYFKQLLQVLTYLKSHNILHEDLKADNILVKRNTTLIAVTDFGLARRMNVDCEMKGMVPIGSQTQWSPEKATSDGHGFAADVWAAVCILVHILSGHPPWTKRFPGLQMLHFVIFTQSPPLVDVPSNIQEVLLDLITQGFTVDPMLRPSAADLLKHTAFRIIDQGAPETFYSTLLSSGQAIPNNMLDTSDTGPQEMQDILASLSVKSQPLDSRSESEEQGAGADSDQNRSLMSGSGRAQAADCTLEAEERNGDRQSSLERNSSEDQSGSILRQNSDKDPTVVSQGTTHTASITEASGATEIQNAEGTMETHFGNLPLILQPSLSGEPDGGLESCSGYATSPDSFEDPEDCFERFLHDDVLFSGFTTEPRHLKLYQPPEKLLSKKTDPEIQNPGAGEPVLPRWSLLLGDLSLSGIVFVDDTNEGEVEEKKDEESQRDIQEAAYMKPEEALCVSGGLNNSNTFSHSSRGSSGGLQSPVQRSPVLIRRQSPSQISRHSPSQTSPILIGQPSPSQMSPSLIRRQTLSQASSHHGSSRGSPVPSNDPGYISPSEMKPLKIGFNLIAGRQSPVVNIIPEDPTPTSIYPPTNLFDEHFDSGDLFGDPSDPMGSMLLTKHSISPPYKQSQTYSRDQMSSLETHMPSGGHHSGSSSSSKNVYFADEVKPTNVNTLSGSPDSEFPHYTKPRSASTPNVSVLNRGTADFVIESSRDKDCPVVSGSLDMPDDFQIGGVPTDENLQKLSQEGERSEKKRPGLTLDVNLSPKKHSFQRIQSTPVGGSQPASDGLAHPKTCPGDINIYSVKVSKKTENSSGLGTSVSNEEVRYNSNRSSDTSGKWTSDVKGRHSSAEMSPSTPKSQFDHQEKEFCALEQASQSDRSAHDQDEMILALGDLQDDPEGVEFHLGPDKESFEDQLASIQKQIPDGHEDVGHKYHLFRDDNSPLSPIRVPSRFEEWRQVIDMIRQVVTQEGFEHFTLKYRNDDVPVDYNAPLTPTDMELKVCAVQEELVEDFEAGHNCWCEQHEDQMRAMA